MPQTMTLDEKLAIGVKAHNYKIAGNMEEFKRILREEIPLAPYLAEFAKNRLGPDFLVKGGFNLSEAEAEFGEDWLSK
ncbi:hypothetical protein FACS189450_01930 [Spirochaetia bacterium]|nr:hypothetical protein FACS189450_01930 [Spirochaetia bacterium]